MERTIEESLILVSYDMPLLMNVDLINRSSSHPLVEVMTAKWIHANICLSSILPAVPSLAPINPPAIMCCHTETHMHLTFESPLNTTFVCSWSWTGYEAVKALFIQHLLVPAICGINIIGSKAKSHLCDQTGKRLKHVVWSLPNTAQEGVNIAFGPLVNIYSSRPV